MNTGKYRVEAGSKIDLEKIDCDDRSLFDGEKDDAKEKLIALCEELADLQRRLWVSKAHMVLFVLQGMDTSGKNGTIRRVFRMTDPHGVDVASFDKPTREELAHDFLWRVHRKCPPRGQIVIFDRSHYEDVTAVRVNRLQPEEVWRKRFRHINDFESMLVEEGTVIVKIFLHIDQATQKERLQARLDDPEKQWKFDESDLVARKRWGDYMKAYSEVFERTSLPHAPWYIVPSNRKWYRNLIVAEIACNTLRKLEMKYPEVGFDPKAIRIPD